MEDIFKTEARKELIETLEGYGYSTAAIQTALELANKTCERLFSTLHQEIETALPETVQGEQEARVPALVLAMLMIKAHAERTSPFLLDCLQIGGGLSEAIRLRKQ